MLHPFTRLGCTPHAVLIQCSWINPWTLHLLEVDQSMRPCRPNPPKPAAAVITCKVFAVVLLAAASLAAWPQSAEASRPVRRTIVGCVLNGAFISHDGYHIRVWRSQHRRMDLSLFEGKEIRFSGVLSPGDNYVVQSDPEVIGPCG
jgi:hypothetical protein